MQVGRRARVGPAVRVLLPGARGQEEQGAGREKDAVGQRVVGRGGDRLPVPGGEETGR